MNDVTTISAVNSQSSFTENADARRADLEQARRRATANKVADAEVAQERRAEQFRESNEIISRAIGANTRLEISAGQGSNPFTYRAIDIDSGEVVSEWPPAQFANLLSTLTSDAQATGLVVNEQV